MSQTRPLPPGWQEAKDPDTGEPYYYNNQGQTVWEFPEEAQPQHAGEVHGASSQQTTSGQSPAQNPQKPPAPQNRGAQPSSSSHPPIKADSLEKALVNIIMTIAFFPFTGTLQLVIYLAVLCGWAAFCFFTGISALNGQQGADATHQLYLIFSGIEAFLRLGLHIVLLWGPARVILKSQPISLKSIPLRMLPADNELHVRLFFAAIVVNVIHIAFTLVWGMRGLMSFNGSTPMDRYSLFYLHFLEVIIKFSACADLASFAVTATFITAFVYIRYSWPTLTA